MEDEVRLLARKVALACRILAMNGLVKETTGHVSARVPGTPHMLIRGRGDDETGLLFTAEEDIVRTNFDGAVQQGPSHVGTPYELPIHGEIYKRRSSVGCVVHAHPPAALLCGITGVELRPIFGAYDPSAMKLAHEGIPVFPRATTLTSPAHVAPMLEIMGEKDVCLMRGHGITVTGDTIEEATVRAIKFETLARVNWLASQRGRTPEIAQEDMLEFVKPPTPGARRSTNAIWRYYEQLLRLNLSFASQELQLG